MRDYKLQCSKGYVSVMLIAFSVFTLWVYYSLLDLSVARLIKYSAYMMLGYLILYAGQRVSIKQLLKFSSSAYILVTCLLVMVLFSDPVNGSHRWIDLVFFKMQPSEFMKLVLPLAICSIYKNNYNKKFLDLLAIALLLLPVMLVLIEPDLGSALFLLFEGVFCIFLMSNIKKLIIACVVLLVIVTPLVYMSLKPYQLMRILLYMNKENVPFEYAFQLMQSIASIVSGGVWGLGKGVISHVNMQFLSDHETDFIFSILAQYLGFIKTTLYITLVFSVFWCSNFIACSCKNKMYKVIRKTYVFSMCMAVMINVGMNMALMPVVGLSFPLLSYGGSNYVVVMAMYAIILQQSNEDMSCNKGVKGVCDD